MAVLGTKELLPFTIEDVADDEILLTISKDVDPEAVKSWLGAYGIDAIYVPGVRKVGDVTETSQSYFKVGENSHIDRPRLIESLVSVGREAVAEAVSGTRQSGELLNLLQAE